jgi:hypothetical protein
VRGIGTWGMIIRGGKGAELSFWVSFWINVIWTCVVLEVKVNI